jgi:hypothetical protein
MTKRWTPERRKQVAERALKHRIWEYSTGPRTSEGKAISSMNAKKHGLRGGFLRLADILLSRHNKLLKELA